MKGRTISSIRLVSFGTKTAIIWLPISPPADEIRQYRVDRMRSVRVRDEQFIPDPYFNLQEYMRKMFHMFGGELISLEAKFADKLINIVKL
ncbi:WYL domain-containing protein [Sporosarcina sp. USHLN248]|uniref:WYL domain-containing protein n=1 Tax=Sporosarcina sp. USHLN248 TaxID=3081300 RepID=UPI003019517D